MECLNKTITALNQAKIADIDFNAFFQEFRAWVMSLCCMLLTIERRLEFTKQFLKCNINAHEFDPPFLESFSRTCFRQICMDFEKMFLMVNG